MAIMKNLFLGLALLVLSEVHAQDLDSSCFELIKNQNLNQACCKQRKIWLDDGDSSEFERCKNIKRDTKEGLCAFRVCVFEEFGFIKDGKLQHDIIPKNESNDPFFTGLKRRCLGDENQSITLNKCETAALFAACIYLNTAVTCDVWDEKENCKKTVATAKKCEQSLDGLMV